MLAGRNACCSSSASMKYWLCATICSWAILSLIGTIWQPLHATSAITVLFAMSAGCFANWIRNRTYHCFIDGPLFLVAASLFLLRALGLYTFPRRRYGFLFSLECRSHSGWSGAFPGNVNDASTRSYESPIARGEECGEVEGAVGTIK